MYSGPIVGLSPRCFRMVPGISRDTERESLEVQAIQREIDEGKEMEALW